MQKEFNNWLLNNECSRLKQGQGLKTSEVPLYPVFAWVLPSLPQPQGTCIQYIASHVACVSCSCYVWTECLLTLKLNLKMIYY